MKKLSLVIPCYNEEKTLSDIIERALRLQGGDLALELVIVDDCSTDASCKIAEDAAAKHPEVKLLRQSANRGKGAALRAGFAAASGDYVGIQDADLEYDPADYLKLIAGLEKTGCDAIYGSRYLVNSPRLADGFFHTFLNRALTLFSNIFTDFALTDMETCYKLFRREVIRELAPELRENRFGFEPEITARLARGHYRVAEAAISYSPRTYAEGKKITWRDGLRTLYCIVRYNARNVPAPTQLLIYFFIGLLSAVVDVALFALFRVWSWPLYLAVGGAYVLAAAFNYTLCVRLLFKPRFNARELLTYAITAVSMYFLDLGVTAGLIMLGLPEVISKAVSIVVGFFGNFTLRKFWVFGSSGADQRQPEKRA